VSWGAGENFLSYLTFEYSTVDKILTEESSGKSDRRVSSSSSGLIAAQELAIQLLLDEC
jgi:hypothetical protein